MALDAAEVQSGGIAVEDSAGSLSTEDRLIGDTGERTQVTIYTDPVTGEKTVTGIGW